MNADQTGSWNYYKLLLGNYVWAYDQLISDMAEIVQDPRVKQWFFIRYADEDGFHIRLRLRTPATDGKAFDREIYPKLHDMVMQLSNLPVEKVVKLVKVPGQEFNRATSYGVKRDQYKPETDIYGGIAGVAIAERLFQISSEIAVDLIREDRKGSISRKDLAPTLMLATLEEFKISKSLTSFLSYYTDYWIMSVPSGDEYITVFEDKCRDLMNSGIPIVRPDDQYNPMSSAILKKWRKSLSEAQAAYKKIDVYTETLAERLLFYFIHLMNNRLGFNILDEIYLAVLVKGWKERGKAV
jgi:thiopeptide-type bacteriocin biosynthesis protein